jgi:hypothetical protein
MRATDIIRGVLDLIDQVECTRETDTHNVEVTVMQGDTTGVDSNRFKQIFDMLSAEKHQTYDNSPNEVVSGIESVTTHAGGGWNGPKNPADIKADSISMYPNYLHNPRE